MATEWLPERLAYLRGLRNPTEQQRLMLLLAEKIDRTADDERKLKALVRAEKAAQRAQRARADAARILDIEKTAARKARDHEMYQVAGLMGLAGLLDKATGRPTRDRGELLGALMDLARIQDSEKSAIWKRAGDSLLAQMERGR
ncbi:conjugal transfer protein TraD [Achromobacter dolens]|uniref:conjugal transfer protein TraD n=2 Tax=Achromobacter dolens TaxID=1287738 RepID=UPI0035574EF8